ncbi:hypothetical protein HID58_075964, partial [Brassica napus]
FFYRTKFYNLRSPKTIDGHEIGSNLRQVSGCFICQRRWIMGVILISTGPSALELYFCLIHFWEAGTGSKGGALIGLELLIIAEQGPFPSAQCHHQVFSSTKISTHNRLLQLLMVILVLTMRCLHVPQALIDTIGQTHRFKVKVFEYKGRTQAITVMKVVSPAVLQPLTAPVGIPLATTFKVPLFSAS